MYSIYKCLNTINLWERVNPPLTFPEFDDDAHLFHHINDVNAFLGDVAVTPNSLSVLVTQATAHVYSLLARPIVNDL